MTMMVSLPNGDPDKELELHYVDGIIGTGSFGIVSMAKIVQTNEEVAVKKVLQDKRFKNRELQIMRTLDHPNVVKLKYFFYNTDEKKDEVFLNLILEYVPETLYRIIRHHSKHKKSVEMIYVKLYAYQLFRALGYVHSIGICHRDVKPQNLLVNPKTGVLKICDFGSAKTLIPKERNVSYICSRYYRAPELIFDAQLYTTSIDMWSAGTVFAELMLGKPLFSGESNVDQIVKIIKVLGTPTSKEITEMNPDYAVPNIPHIRPLTWQKVFQSETPSNAIDLISNILKYAPNSRLTPLEAMAHEFFDELRLTDCKLPSQLVLPPLFDFTEQELKNADKLRSKLMPKSESKW